MKLYIVKNNPTLNGEPAGPDEGEYLDFVPGDAVVVVKKGGWYGTDPHQVVAERLRDGRQQVIDKKSLRRVGKHLVLDRSTDVDFL